MGVSWTKEQQQVIDLRNRNILVSAAAGSGKTAVLVERIIKMITDPGRPVDIDRLLIVTFTNAAAAEMRERIGNAIEQSLLQNPDDEHLLRQMTLIHNAQITTIDSFCLYVIRNHFHEIDLEPGFRIADEGELKLLKEDVIKRVLERNYEETAPAFIAFTEGYAAGRTDAALNGMILSLYEFSRSYPWPEEWLDSCAGNYGITDRKELNDAVFIKPLVENIRAVVNDMAALAEQALALAKAGDGPHMYEKALQNDLEKYQAIASCRTFTEFYDALGNISYDRLASSRGYDGSVWKLDRVKELREIAKDAVKKLKKQYFYAPPQVMAEQLEKTGPMAQELVRLTKEFADAFAAEKRRKNLVDFHDLEHFALQILVDRETKGARETAEEFRDTFEEIMIDEYQDSNYVQETILRAISREDRGQNNIFMVGDVKQSIYRFRLARPELFMEKYDTYGTEEGSRQRIDLHKNFRSRDEVLTFTNDIFYKIMARDLGNVEYDADAALYPGASYPASGHFKPQVLLADSSDELLEGSGYGDKKLLEAKMAAGEIKRMMETLQVTDKATGELRRVKYSDIVILLRSQSGWADAFAVVLNDAGIPAHTVSSTGYFSAMEVQTVLSMLRILDNPRQDIPLTAVLRSPIGGLSDEELALLRLRNREVSFHACVLAECERLSELPDDSTPTERDTGLNRKLKEFYRKYMNLRKLVPDTPIHELIELVLKETGYGNYAQAMPAGARRRANLEMLAEKAIAYERTSYKGLFHFVRYIDELQKYDVDFGEADMVSENEEVVRIMSIHKSKGLEFPIVFVAGLGKNFNRQDVRSRMVLHPELGIGLDFMDGTKRVKSPTIAKKAIAKQIDIENLGEELRVLYVALTRAKEKLILTGSLKNAGEQLEKARFAAAFSNDGNERGGRTGNFGKGNAGPLLYLQREGASGYLDWLLPAILSYGEKYPVRIPETAELVTEELREQIGKVLDKDVCMETIRKADAGLVESLDRRFAAEYPYRTKGWQKNKYSVSELKHRAMRERMEQEEENLTQVFLKEEIIPYVPAFAGGIEEKKEEINRGALRGTAVHRVLECYCFSSGEPAEVQLEKMLAQEKITPELKELVKVPLVEAFLSSEAGERMKKAEKKGKLYREKPFVMGFTEEELKQFGFGDQEEAGHAEKNGGTDLTLIQGIIDVFWMEEDGIILLDYKTDQVSTEEELIGRYAAQLNLYAEALERIYNPAGTRSIKVKEKLLYSFRLGKVILVR